LGQQEGSRPSGSRINVRELEYHPFGVGVGGLGGIEAQGLGVQPHSDLPSQDIARGALPGTAGQQKKCQKQ
jgi:hypothetical protein